MVPALDQEQYRPLLLNYGRIALLCEQAYQELRKQESLMNDEGELRSSLLTYKALAGEMRAAARELGLTPSTAALLARPVAFLDLSSIRGEEPEPAGDGDDDGETDSE